MAISLKHKSRNPERDQNTDRARLTRLTSTLSAIVEEIRSEEAGLRTRYESETADACFLEAAEEGEGSSTILDARMEDVTASLLHSEKRLRNLALQLAFFEDKRSTIDAEFDALAKQF